MRGEFLRRQGQKIALIRTLITPHTDALILTETRASITTVSKLKLKYGMTPEHYSLNEGAKAGVIIYTKMEHKIIPESKREGSIPGHMAAAVYNIHNSRVIIVGIYGPSENNDKVSAKYFHEIEHTITELKHIYNTQHVILAGDFNAVWREEDANNHHSTKQRTTRALQNIMHKHNIDDLALVTNNTKHTWHRHGSTSQSSRIDYIMTSIPHKNTQTQTTKLDTTYTSFDHAYVQAQFGQNIIKQTPTMKDFILGSEEYIIKSTEYLEHIINQAQNRTTAQNNTNTAEHPEQHMEYYTNPLQGQTALHILNKAISDLHKIHDQIAKEKGAKTREYVQRISASIYKLKQKLKKETNVECKHNIAEQIETLQRQLTQNIEAKEQAAQMRIQNFYKTATGKMTPQSFFCIKERNASRKIVKLIMDEKEITDQEEITQIMQEWYENTATVSIPQTITLQQFLDKHNIQLPQLSKEHQEELSEEFTQQEVADAIQDASEQSAPGPTGQTIAFYKLINAQAPELLTEALNQLVFQQELSNSPEFQWIRHRKVIYIPKKQAPIHPSDYRPLSMLEVLYKIPSRILSKRVNKVLPTIIGQHQHGFIRQKGIQEPSLLMTHLIQDANIHNKPLQLISFDIEKAFDRISHTVIIQALEAFGFPQEYIQAVKHYTLIGFAYVEVNGKRGVLITIKTGSGQGDPMSSPMFDIGTEPLCLVLILIMQSILYQDNGGLKVGPTIFADDNMNPVALTKASDLQPALQIYADYHKVSGLSINRMKSSALCINTAQEVVEGLQQLQIHTPTSVKHLGLHLCETMSATIIETLRHTDSKLIQRRILATTPPTDLLHRALLVNTAYMPVINHVLMALPVPCTILTEMDYEVRNFFWTRQQNGETKQKRRKVAKNRIASSLHMGGLKVPPFQTIADGFQLNLLQKIFKREQYPNRYPRSHLPGLLDTILRQKGRPSLQEHIETKGPNEWLRTAQQIKHINPYLGSAFQVGAQTLIDIEKDAKHWHMAPIHGHSLEGPFTLSTLEAQTLQQHQIITVGQLYEARDNGSISHDFNQSLDQHDTLAQSIKTKLRNLALNAKKGHMHSQEDRAVSMSCLSYIMNKDTNISSYHRKTQRSKLDQQLKIAPAYNTRQRDNVYVPEKNTFNQAYLVVNLPGMPSKTKETAFEILNRTIWTNNKAFKSNLTDTPTCALCPEIENMEHLLMECQHYSALVWKEISQLLTKTAADENQQQVSTINLTPREIIYNAPHPSILLHFKDSQARNIILQYIQETKRDIIYRRMNIREGQMGKKVPQIQIQAHILSTLKKLEMLLQYQGLFTNRNAICMLQKMQQIIQNTIE
jgi:exonuclease III